MSNMLSNMLSKYSVSHRHDHVFYLIEDISKVVYGDPVYHPVLDVDYPQNTLLQLIPHIQMLYNLANKADD